MNHASPDDERGPWVPDIRPLAPRVVPAGGGLGSVRAIAPRRPSRIFAPA